MSPRSRARLVVLSACLAQALAFELPGAMASIQATPVETIHFTRGEPGVEYDASSNELMVRGWSVEPSTRNPDLRLVPDGDAYVLLDFGGAILRHADPGTLITAAIDRLGTPGGVLEIAPGVYRLRSVPQLPPSLDDWLVIRGGGEETRFMLGPEATRAFGMRPSVQAPAEYRNIWLEGFALDAAFIEGRHQEPVLWGYTEGMEWYAAFRNIVVRDVSASNIVEGSFRKTLDFTTAHPPAGDMYQTVSRGVFIARLKMIGGWTGLGFGCGAAPMCRHEVDDVTVLDSSHIQLGAPAGDHPGTGVHVGGYANVGRVYIRGFYSENSGDDGIEINQPREAVIEGSIVRNALIHAIVLTNYRPDTMDYRRNWVVRKTSVIVDRELDHPGSLKGQGFVVGGLSTLAPGARNPVDSVVLEQVDYLNTGNGDGPLFALGRVRRLSINGFSAQSTRDVDGASFRISHTNDAGARIWLYGDGSPDSQAEISIQGFRFDQVYRYSASTCDTDQDGFSDGECTSQFRFFDISGPRVSLSLSAIDLRMSASGLDCPGCGAVGFALGTYAYDGDGNGSVDPSSIEGAVRSVRYTLEGDADISSAIRIAPTAKLNKRIRLNRITSIGAPALSFEAPASPEGLACGGRGAVTPNCGTVRWRPPRSVSVGSSDGAEGIARKRREARESASE